MASKRQVVFIMTDTQRKDMLGCYGNPGMITPNLDRLAQEGVRFENAYTCQPVCGPARAALFTGTYPHSNGSWANCMPLGANVKTIGQRLSDRAVPTAYIGKWHLDGGDYFGLGRCPAGWDARYWYDMRNYLEELSPEDRVRSRSPQLNQDPSVTEDFTFGHRCSDRAIRYLQEKQGEDFLLVVSYDEPHGPHVCPKKYYDMYKDYAFPKKANVWDKLADKPAHQKIWAGDFLFEDKDTFQIRYPGLFACNSFVDFEIGRVLAAIDRLVPDALVIYTSDHGDMFSSHSLWSKGPAMYQEITNVPFIVRWPRHAPAGAVSTQLLSHVDIAPSLMSYFGLPVPRVLEGTDLTESLSSVNAQTHDYVFLEFGRYETDHDGFGGFQPIRCCLDKRYKLVLNLLTTDELYDLEKDPQEMDNRILSPEYHAIRDRLHDQLLDWMNRTRDPFRGYYWERRPWRAEPRPATWNYTGMTRQRETDEYEPRQLDYDTGLEMKDAVKKK